MEDLNDIKLIIEGIKEAIEDVDIDEVYYLYGKLIAEEKLDFDTNLLNDKTALHKAVMNYKPRRENSIDW